MCSTIRSVRPMPGNPRQSLGNSLASSRKHKRKLKKRLQVFVLKWSFVALARCSFRATSELKQGRFWATHVNGSESFSLLISLDATKFVLLIIFTLKETICSKICLKSWPKIAKRPTCVSQKRSCLSSCSQYPWAWSYCTLANVASFHVLAQTELLKRLQFLMMACVSVFCACSLTALINESICRLLSIHWKSLKHESPIRIPR